MPPYVVFSDATLVAIADARPTQRGRRWPGSPASARRSSSRYADPLLAVLGGADPAAVAPVEVG